MSKLFAKKPLSLLLRESSDENTSEGTSFKRNLTALNLTLLGVGGIIGAGIFSLTGTAAAQYAGPGIIISFVISGILCAFAGLCYAEMAAMVPVSGSAYAYTYATMGEFIAWIVGWDLVLEYGFGAVTVATSWSGYFVSLLQKTLHIELSPFFLKLTKGPWETVTLASGDIVHGIWNLPASLISLVVAVILLRGIKESARINNIIVFVKIAIILIFIILGWAVMDSANWIVNPEGVGLSKIIPLATTVFRHGQEMNAFGWEGVFTGAGVVFFAYIGFDAVSTTAQETKNPQRALPIGILASLVICTVIYILMALVMTGVVPYQQLNVPDPVAVGIDKIIELRGWSESAKLPFAFTVKLGALAGLTSVILVLMLGQTRVIYAMAKDGLLPWFSRIHPVFGTPSSATLFTGLFVAIAAGLMPMTLVGELVSIGTLLAFVLVCLGVIILRKTNPEIHRPFKTPVYWLIAPAGIFSCLWVMKSLPVDTWIRLIVWLAIGFVIYAFYGRKHSKIQATLDGHRQFEDDRDNKSK